MLKTRYGRVFLLILTICFFFLFLTYVHTSSEDEPNLVQSRKSLSSSVTQRVWRGLSYGIWLKRYMVIKIYVVFYEKLILKQWVAICASIWRRNFQQTSVNNMHVVPESQEELCSDIEIDHRPEVSCRIQDYILSCH